MAKRHLLPVCAHDEIGARKRHLVAEYTHSAVVPDFAVVEGEICGAFGIKETVQRGELAPRNQVALLDAFFKPVGFAVHTDPVVTDLLVLIAHLQFLLFQTFPVWRSTG
jgi:hypothetical protein